MTQQLKGGISYTDHRQANIFLDINNKAQAIYDSKDVNLPDGWYHKISSGQYISNFKAIVLQNGDRYAIVYFGTDVTSGRDIWADTKMALNQNPQQFKDALKFTEKFMKDNDVQPYQIDIIGNSEGASEGMYVMSKIEGINHGTFFNGYPPNNVEIDDETQSRIDNYRHKDDVISKCGPSIGNDHIVDYKEGYATTKTTPKFVESHRIKNMGDLTKSTPAKEYKISNPEFKNKYREGELKSHEVGDIPKEIYPLADKDVNDRLRKGMVIKENKPAKTSSSSQCVGSYPVSGYTRGDGTYVSDYTRSCGAAHSGNNPNKSNYVSKNKSSNNFAPSNNNYRMDDSFSNAKVIMNFNKKDISMQSTSDQPIPETHTEPGCSNPEMMDKEFKKYRKQQQEFLKDIIDLLTNRT